MALVCHHLFIEPKPYVWAEIGAPEFYTRLFPRNMVANLSISKTYKKRKSLFR